MIKRYTNLYIYFSLLRDKPTFITPVLFCGTLLILHRVWVAKIIVIRWQVSVKSFVHKPDSGHYFNRIHQMAPTAQQRATITLERVPTVLVLLWSE